MEMTTVAVRRVHDVPAHVWPVEFGNAIQLEAVRVEEGRHGVEDVPIRVVRCEVGVFGWVCGRAVPLVQHRDDVVRRALVHETDVQNRVARGVLSSATQRRGDSR